MTPVPAQVTLCTLAFSTTMETLVTLIVHGAESFRTALGQELVQVTLEIVDEALSRGMHAG